MVKEEEILAFRKKIHRRPSPKIFVTDNCWSLALLVFTSNLFVTYLGRATPMYFLKATFSSFFPRLFFLPAATASFKPLVLWQMVGKKMTWGRKIGRKMYGGRRKETTSQQKFIHD